MREGRCLKKELEEGTEYTGEGGEPGPVMGQGWGLGEFGGENRRVVECEEQVAGPRCLDH